MKKVCKGVMIFVLSVGLALSPTRHCQAQFTDIIKAIIKAADIAVQKVQNATIDLQNAQKQIENALSQSKLADIASWVQKQKDLYQDYFKELWEVKTVIAYYQRVTAVIEAQKRLVNEYKQAYALIQKDKHFSPTEFNYIRSVYAGIIDESIKSLDQLLDIITSFSVQMSDAERLKMINRCAEDIDQQISDLHRFNNQTIQVSLQRAKDQEDINMIRQLYGL